MSPTLTNQIYICPQVKLYFCSKCEIYICPQVKLYICSKCEIYICPQVKLYIFLNVKYIFVPRLNYIFRWLLAVCIIHHYSQNEKNQHIRWFLAVAIFFTMFQFSLQSDGCWKKNLNIRWLLKKTKISDGCWKTQI